MYFCVNTSATLKNRFWKWCIDGSRETCLLQIIYVAIWVCKWGDGYLRNRDSPCPKYLSYTSIWRLRENMPLCVWPSKTQEPQVWRLCILSTTRGFHFAILKQFQLLISSSHFSAVCWELLISCSSLLLSDVILLGFLWLITGQNLENYSF